MPDPDDLHRLAPQVDNERAAAAFRRRRRQARSYRRGAWAAGAAVLVVGGSVVVAANVGDEDTLTRTGPATPSCDVVSVASGCSDGDDGDAVSSTTTERSATTTTEQSSMTTEATSTTTEPRPAAGSLASATIAVRAACREFYAYNPNNIDELLTSAELAAQCDAPAPEWRADCYAERPGEFAPGDGGCAYLGGYLAVWLGEQTFAEGRVFRSGDDVWTVIPESD